jgi:hypothetical protein
MAADWLVAHRQGSTDPMIAGPNSIRRALNARARALLNAEGDLLTFYETERGRWSSRLNTALTQLANIDSPAEDRTDDEEHPAVG